MSANDATELRRLYGLRFDRSAAYRQRVWQVLVRDFFQSYIQPGETVLDLGCGYGEFINHIRCGKRYGMDLNPEARTHLVPEVELLEQDCSTRWPFAEGSLQTVFTSNFFEHLPTKAALKATLEETYRCLAPGGQLMALGPNIKYLAGDYWDFWDHHLALSEISLSEGLRSCGFEIRECVDRFLPYTMVHARPYPMFFITAFLRLRFTWKLVGKQFLIVAQKPAAGPVQKSGA